ESTVVIDFRQLALIDSVLQCLDLFEAVGHPIRRSQPELFVDGVEHLLSLILNFDLGRCVLYLKNIFRRIRQTRKKCLEGPVDARTPRYPSHINHASIADLWIEAGHLFSFTVLFVYSRTLTFHFLIELFKRDILESLRVPSPLVDLRFLKSREAPSFHFGLELTDDSFPSFTRLHSTSVLEPLDEVKHCFFSLFLETLGRISFRECLFDRCWLEARDSSKDCIGEFHLGYVIPILRHPPGRIIDLVNLMGRVGSRDIPKNIYDIFRNEVVYPTFEVFRLRPKSNEPFPRLR